NLFGVRRSTPLVPFGSSKEGTVEKPCGLSKVCDESKLVGSSMMSIPKLKLERGKLSGLATQRLLFCAKTLLLQKQTFDVLAKDRVWDREGCNLGDSRMFHDDLVHFAGRDLFASAVDDFFQSAGDKKIAISIQVALVSRPQPAIGEGLLIGSRIIFVALHDIRTT